VHLCSILAPFEYLRSFVLVVRNLIEAELVLVDNFISILREAMASDNLFTTYVPKSPGFGPESVSFF